MERLSGLRSGDALGRLVHEIVPFFREGRDGQLLTDALSGTGSVTRGRPYNSTQSVESVCDVHLLPLKSPSGAFVGGLAILRDVTDRHRVDLLLGRRSEQLRVVREVGELCVAATGLQGTLDHVAAALLRGLDAPLCEIFTLNEIGDGLVRTTGFGWPSSVMGPPTVMVTDDTLESCVVRGNAPIVSERLDDDSRFTIPSRAREQGVIAAMGVPIQAGGRPIGVLAVYATRPRALSADDMEFLQSVAVVLAGAMERNRIEHEIEDDAILDGVTGLYNRRYFEGRLDEEIVRASRGRRPLAVMVCDLERFHVINEMRGRRSGDDVLKAVAQSILGAVREMDLAVRYGPDEVAVLLPDLGSDHVIVAADRVRRSVRTLGDAWQLPLDVSIGVALYPDHGTARTDLERVADRALHFAKKEGGKFHIGEEELRLSERSINVVFQPIVELNGRSVIGYEALGREPDGKVGILDLFKRFQAIGRIREFKRLCFDVQLRAASDLGLSRVFLNVDFEMLHDVDPPDLPEGLTVVLEVSEHDALTGSENHLQIAKGWRKKGYGFAVDDFSAGFVALPFIGHLMPDYIKLDRSAILQAVASERFRAFSLDLVAGLKNYVRVGIIAEGIETEDELRLTKELGVGLGQGFLFGHPSALTPEMVKSSRPRAA